MLTATETPPLAVWLGARPVGLTWPCPRVPAPLPRHGHGDVPSPMRDRQRLLNVQTQPLPPELPAADHFLLSKRTKPKPEILPSFSQKIGILKTISQGVGLPPSPLDSFILHPKGACSQRPSGTRCPMPRWPRTDTPAEVRCGAEHHHHCWTLPPEVSFRRTQIPNTLHAPCIWSSRRVCG